MPLSFGIPLGLVLAVVGLVLFLATEYKQAGRAVMLTGLALALLAFVLVLLAASSSM